MPFANHPPVTNVAALMAGTLTASAAYALDCTMSGGFEFSGVLPSSTPTAFGVLSNPVLTQATLGGL